MFSLLPFRIQSHINICLCTAQYLGKSIMDIIFLWFESSLISSFKLRLHIERFPVHTHRCTSEYTSSWTSEYTLSWLYTCHEYTCHECTWHPSANILVMDINTCHEPVNILVMALSAQYFPLISSVTRPSLLASICNLVTRTHSFAQKREASLTKTVPHLVYNISQTTAGKYWNCALIAYYTWR